MPHARFFAACISLGTAGSVFVGGAVLLCDAAALAAPRRATKPIRRTASAPPSAGGQADTSPSSGAAPSEDALFAQPTSGATPPAQSKAVPAAVDERPKDVLSGGKSRERGSRGRARLLADAPNGGRDSDALREGAPVKATQDGGAPAKGPLPDTARALQPSSKSPSPAIAAVRPADVRSSAAKGPSEAPSSPKSTAEKFAAETASDAAESSRTPMDSGANLRRELSASSLIASARPVVVSLDGLVFDGGDVPRAAAALDRMKPAFTRCASAENALIKNEASLDLRFLVRAPGRAEGVDVDKARGLSGDVVRCMTSALARSYIGAPSDDPVGVAITVRLRRRPEAAND
jgi:hypothetical protein